MYHPRKEQSALPEGVREDFSKEMSEYRRTSMHFSGGKGREEIFMHVEQYVQIYLVIKTGERFTAIELYSKE